MDGKALIHALDGAELSARSLACGSAILPVRDSVLPRAARSVLQAGRRGPALRWGRDRGSDGARAAGLMVDG